MKAPNRRCRRRSEPVPRATGGRRRLAEWADDPRYLEVKQQLGETLTPREQAILDAACGSGIPAAERQGGDP
jgi:hypothetical protein